MPDPVTVGRAVKVGFSRSENGWSITCDQGRGQQAGFTEPADEAVRGWNNKSSRLDKMTGETARRQIRRKKLCRNNAFRDRTQFLSKTSFSRFEMFVRAACGTEMEDLLADPDGMIETGKLLKDGDSSTVALVRVGGRSLVIKRYNFKNTWHRIRRLFRRSRAWRSWANAWHLESLGVPSVKPVALIENRFGPIVGTAYFVSEYIEGVDALNWLRGTRDWHGEPEALTAILEQLSASRISHGDLKATNFIMSATGPVILDLDSMREHKNTGRFERAFKKDIDRFMRNWHDRPELAHRFEGLLAKLSR